MLTPWGETLDPNKVLGEYPRPQLRRDSYLNLNGLWEYAITDTDEAPRGFDGKILVPFSPEAPLSGVNRQLQPAQTLWYQTTFCLPEGFCKDRVLLHFGAVDRECAVYVNGTAAAFHMGGYLPFSMDITALLQAENLLTVRVKDPTDTTEGSRGKQKTKRGGIWYTPQSGIWQTVWLESVPTQYIKRLKITPLYDDDAVEITAKTDIDAPCCIETDGMEVRCVSNSAVRIPLRHVEHWSPEHPKLYDLTVTVGDDRVESYFAMRKFSVAFDEDGVRRLFLNDEPYFETGVLDQGYWPDGLYTAPSDEAMIYDIQTMKDMGFNMLRKHIKIEPLRWYYHCDRLGMIVWQDMPSGGGSYRLPTISLPLITGIHHKDHDYRRFSREDPVEREQYRVELADMVTLLYNAPCISTWVPFNEGWGQFDAVEAVALIESIDKTRRIDHASGWHDQGIGEIKSLHVYFRKYRFLRDKKRRAVVLSEFGGYNYMEKGHTYNDRDFGYRKLASSAALLSEFAALYEKQILPAVKKGLAATVYTQLSDVEDEVNGLVTYDRRVEKLDREAVARINTLLCQNGKNK